MLPFNRTHARLQSEMGLRGHCVTFSTYGNPDRTGAVHVRNRAGERVVRVDELGRITTTR